MNKYIAPFFFVAVIGNVQAAEITETHVTGTRFKFTAKLDAPLIAGNKVKIEFGKNLLPMTCVETTCTLFRTMNSDVMPAYKIGIYNSKNVLQVAENHTATKSYTKIANDGSELPDSAQLGTNPKDWACTKDNKTGLIWEVKTDDGGLRDLNKTYTNYTFDYDPNKLYEAVTNTNGFVLDVNSQSLCGAMDWRIPTKDELFGIVKSDSTPTINITYFPDIKDNYWFWSSSSYAYGSNDAWYVYFSYGVSYGNDKSNSSYVRLVR